MITPSKNSLIARPTPTKPSIIPDKDPLSVGKVVSLARSHNLLFDPLPDSFFNSIGIMAYLAKAVEVTSRTDFDFAKKVLKLFKSFQADLKPKTRVEDGGVLSNLPGPVDRTHDGVMVRLQYKLD